MNMVEHSRKMISFKINNKYKTGQKVFIKSVGSLKSLGSAVYNRFKKYIGEEVLIENYQWKKVCVKLGNDNLLLKESELTSQQNLF